ncbi:hypothetical protein MNEG_5061 [Monoraphidium neglectum]|uniref:FAD-binding PCMH-type domain-containing protein n=1 Tax=Monoraphidium neglectum TaxID=145388 RepID=A0A0D2MR39_9CHLO|nr:hypothetical protein MNEG_5061 [Monoraphidium neglectum]KIZ02902.1 hypothetical protein MNEG_5061 [Monoraphidium neglectum]|eukprot:XP_013901921.1 hypothetical protein MNEG_5061 [Monoraphidium neglectum]
MKRVLSTNKQLKQMRVGAGMALRDFLPAASRAKLSVPRALLPWWGDLNIGGIVSVAGHGSGQGAPVEVCEIVTSITWVDASGTVRTSDSTTEEWRALCGGIGLLGIITEVTFQLTDSTNTQISTRIQVSDANLASDLNDELISKAITLYWRPDFGVYTAHLQTDAPSGKDKSLNITKGARGVIVPQLDPDANARKTQGAGLKAVSTIPFFELPYDNGESLVCQSAIGITTTPWAQVSTFPPKTKGKRAVDIFDGRVVTNDVQTFVCSNNKVELCSFSNPELDATNSDTEMAVEKARIPELIADVKKLIAVDLRGYGNVPDGSKRCLPPGYFNFRFTNPSKTLIGPGAGLAQPVHAELTVIYSRSIPGRPFRYEWVQEIFEQLLLCKYNGRPRSVLHSYAAPSVGL